MTKRTLKKRSKFRILPWPDFKIYITRVIKAIYV